MKYGDRYSDERPTATGVMVAAEDLRPSARKGVPVRVRGCRPSGYGAIGRHGVPKKRYLKVRALLSRPDKAYYTTMEIGRAVDPSL